MFAQSVRPLHLRTPDYHAMALHPAGLGRVTIARRLASGAWREASVPVSNRPYAVRQFQGEHDVYLTQNRFFSRRRLVAHLAELGALFTDLDYCRTPLADSEADPRHVLDLAIETLDLAQMPEPTFALATGRGLALIWLHSPVPRAVLPRWRACQKAIHPTASVCYAWSSPIEGSDRRSFYAVLGVPPINSAADAVRAAIVADEKKRRAAYK